jgi:hypothetical protein
VTVGGDDDEVSTTHGDRTFEIREKGEEHGSGFATLKTRENNCELIISFECVQISWTKRPQLAIQKNIDQSSSEQAPTYLFQLLSTVREL